MEDGVDEMQAVSPNHQASKLQIKDFTNMWFVPEAFGFSEAGAMLSDRERLILHFVSTLTIARTSNIENLEPLMNKMIDDVLRHRCRSIAPEDVADIIDEVNEEFFAGGIMFKEAFEEATWSMTGERPNRNANCSDMR